MSFNVMLCRELLTFSIVDVGLVLVIEGVGNGATSGCAPKK